ncbi:MAG: tail fiber domain-containing protein [Bacteroidales bacterium]
MKARKLVMIVLFICSYFAVKGQVPQGFNYQAIARDASGNPITGQTIEVKIGILSDTLTPVILREELFTSVKTNAFGLFSVVIGTGTFQSGSVPNFSDINWSDKPLFARTYINYPIGSWKYMGSFKLWSVPYSMVARNLGGAVDRLKVSGTLTSMDSALFEVRNRTGQIVFAVYNEGVRIYVDNGRNKASTKGGFAIGGFGAGKSVSQPLFVVDQDSIRAYIDTGLVKARKGGFAIGSFNNAKSPWEQYLSVSRDSTRIFINDQPAKGSKGGFAIGGFNQSKSGNINYLNVATEATGIINPSQNRVLWYPLKNALLAGRVLILKPDSVGLNSFVSGYESRASGDFSQALGYQSYAIGDYSSAIGRKAIATKNNSFAFGDSAQATGVNSYAFGNNSHAVGARSFAFGSWDVDNMSHYFVTEALGNNSVAIGLGAKADGVSAFSIGGVSTYSVIRWPDIVYARNAALADNSMALGFANTANISNSLAIGIGNKSNAYRSMAIGYNNYTYGDYSYASGRQNYSSTAALSSSMIGYGLVTNEPYETIVGAFNDTTSVTGVQFAVGNGTPAFLPTRKNAFLVLRNGSVIIPGTGTLQVGLTNSTTIYDIDAAGEIASRGYNSFRMRGTSYSTFFRNDGSNLYLMLTNSGDPDGTYNSLRPLRVTLSTGNLYLGGGNVSVLNSGYVGIGTGTPNYPLHVATYANASASYGYLNSSGATGTSSGINNYSIFAEYRIRAEEFNADSDERIKAILGASDSRNDFDVIRKIKITNFRYIDTIGKGNQVHKKVIAQELMKVLPVAVSATTGFVPSVYSKPFASYFDVEKGKMIYTMGMEHGLKKGDVVKIIVSNGALNATVSEIITPLVFSIDAQKDLKEVFIYGKEVSDFLTVDYEAISMLNVSATQELIKRMEVQDRQLTEQDEKIRKLERMIEEMQLIIKTGTK